MVRNEVLLDFLEKIKNIKTENLNLNDDELKEIEKDSVQISISDKLIKKFLETNLYCTKCRTFKPKEEFSSLQSFCIKCKKKTQTNYREKSKNVLIECVCGKKINKNSQQKHKISKFHINHINNNS